MTDAAVFKTGDLFSRPLAMRFFFPWMSSVTQDSLRSKIFGVKEKYFDKWYVEQNMTSQKDIANSYFSKIQKLIYLGLIT